MTFWEHLDELRGSLIRMAIAAVAMGLIAFAFKETLFDIVLAPSKSDFFLYRLIGTGPFDIRLINTGLAEQFTIHMKVALTVGLLVASPYILYLLFHFISPALYENERRYSVTITLSAYIMFIIGVALNYFLVFPLTVRFLGTYSVSSEVENMLSLSSYVDSLLMMSLCFGIIFELPVICWILGRLGLLKSEWMTHYRRHAIVAILIIAAIITPTGDIFTLLVVSLPIYILYEASVFLVRR
ncbi:MAG: twin-arginine translocase subunit TatC [Prevotella sp.]|nr:twin-arginine translocase subunit TatC [Prevotella sp.]